MPPIDLGGQPDPAADINAQRDLPSLRRRLLLVLVALSAILLIALGALLVKQSDVRDLVRETNQNTVPAVLDRQQAAANLERMLRFGWIAATAADPGDWRPAGRAAQALSYHPSLAMEGRLRDSVRTLYGMVREVLSLREDALALRLQVNAEPTSSAREELRRRADALDHKARALWAPQDSLLLDVQSSLASDVSRMTVEHFNRIDHIASITQFAGLIVAAVMLLSLGGAAWIVRRELIRPVLQTSDALRSILDQGASARVPLPVATSTEMATIQDAAIRLKRALEDITDQARALRDSEHRLQSIFSTSEAGIAIANADGVVIQANAALSRMTGIAVELMRGVEFGGATHPEDQQVEKELLTATMHGMRSSFRLEKRFVHQDGSIVWVDMTVTALREDNNCVGGLVAVIIDTTEQHHVRQQMLFTQSIIDKSSEPIYCCDPADGFRFVYANAATGRHFGIPSQDLLSLRANEVGANLEDVSERLSTFGAPPPSDPLIIEGVHTVTGGTVRPVEMSVNSFIHMGRDYVAGSIRDITERKQWMDEVKRSNQELQQFAYVASHDLQEPLRMVASFLQLLNQRYSKDLSPEAKEYISFAVDGAVRMKQIIEDLLQYSRLETSRRTLAPVDMALAFDSAMLNLRGAITDSGAVVECQSNLGRGIADQGQMVRLLQNLIGNAIKYRHAERTPRVVVSAKQDDEWWTITISDNGLGISDEYYERIFLIFQRLHSNREFVGTGIGLAICKRIVEHWGGKIWVTSIVGEGSAFHFTLRRADVDKQTPGR
jgi:PAS domain S-box-containing protein